MSRAASPAAVQVLRAPAVHQTRAPNPDLPLPADAPPEPDASGTTLDTLKALHDAMVSGNTEAAAAAAKSVGPSTYASLLTDPQNVFDELQQSLTEHSALSPEQAAKDKQRYLGQSGVPDWLGIGAQTAGDVVGSTIGGTLGAVGGPLAPVTVPAGAAVGGVIGAALPHFVRQLAVGASVPEAARAAAPSPLGLVAQLLLGGGLQAARAARAGLTTAAPAIAQSVVPGAVAPAAAAAAEPLGAAGISEAGTQAALQRIGNIGAGVNRAAGEVGDAVRSTQFPPSGRIVAPADALKGTGAMGTALPGGTGARLVTGDAAQTVAARLGGVSPGGAAPNLSRGTVVAVPPAVVQHTQTIPYTANALKALFGVNASDAVANGLARVAPDGSIYLTETGALKAATSGSLHLTPPPAFNAALNTEKVATQRAALARTAPQLAADQLSQDTAGAYADLNQDLAAALPPRSRKAVLP